MEKKVFSDDQSNLIEKIVSLCKRRGFIFPGSEIYGGLANSWDYGPLGVELKNNIKKNWWQKIVWARNEVVGLDSAIIMNPKTWEASGHLKNFSDPLVECQNCHSRFRADYLKEGKYGELKQKDGRLLCPNCEGLLTEEKKFNLMFKTFLGATEETGDAVFLRPETAQGIFVNFRNVLNSSRKKIPFGIAQIGKSFRNEITPGNFIFRTREFEQMELEYFVKPGEDEKWFFYWTEERLNWYLSLGIKKENLRLRVYEKEELAHYARACADVEYKFPFGWDEVEGIANRGDYDLKNHIKNSLKDLSYFDEIKKESFVPFVIEPSAGVDRSLLVFLLDAYNEEKDESGETRIVLKLNPQLSPIKLAVFPLLRNNDKLLVLAKDIYNQVREKFLCDYDESGSIGRRYRRQDEIGTPWCLTVDHLSLENDTITIRHRDSMEQERIHRDEVLKWVEEKLTS
ncbi:MAG: glycine--tRNA ligase [Candidatus Paceibacterota bacterium]